jgi:hypothetical protein
VVPTVPLSGVDLVEQPAEPYGNSKNAMINRRNRSLQSNRRRRNQLLDKPPANHNKTDENAKMPEIFKFKLKYHHYLTK